MKKYVLILILWPGIGMAKPEIGDSGVSSPCMSQVVSQSMLASQSLVASNHTRRSVDNSVESKQVSDGVGVQSLELRSPDAAFIGLRGWVLKIINDPINFFTLILAVYTYKLSQTTKRLWVEAKIAGKIAEDNAKAARSAADAATRAADAYMITERAWVCVLGAQNEDVYNIVNDRNPLRAGNKFSLRWSNTGKTPVRDVVFQAQSKIVSVDDGEPEFVRQDIGNLDRGVLYPNALVSTQPHQYGEADIQRLAKKEIRIFLYGYASYYDVLGQQKRHTEICLEVEYDGVKNNQRNFAFKQATSYNSIS